MMNEQNGQQAVDEQNGRQAVPPGLQDMMVQQSTRNNDMVREMMTGSSDPSEYLPRARQSKRELARDVRILHQFNLIHNRKSDIPYLMWWRLNGSISIDSEGRKEAVQMITGQPRGFFRRGRGFLSKYKTPDGAEVSE